MSKSHVRHDQLPQEQIQVALREASVASCNGNKDLMRVIRRAARIAEKYDDLDALRELLTMVPRAQGQSKVAAHIQNMVQRRGG